MGGKSLPEGNTHNKTESKRGKVSGIRCNLQVLLFVRILKKTNCLKNIFLYCPLSNKFEAKMGSRPSFYLNNYQTRETVMLKPMVSVFLSLSHKRALGSVSGMLFKVVNDLQLLVYSNVRNISSNCPRSLFVGHISALTEKADFPHWSIQSPVR